jgi:iron complex transport system ATP-binding protein
VVIRASGLDLGYGERLVLKDLNFEIRPGEFVGCLGPNGSGKSTLLNALCGFLPPRKGSLLYEGVPLRQMESRMRARRLAVVPQATEVHFPFTCFEVVLMGRYPHRRRWRHLGSEDLVAAVTAMARTTTTFLKDRPVTEVSGGERQRVIVARALAQTPEVLLLDEATSQMDVRKKLEIFEVLQFLNESHNVTVICAMHDLNLAALFCRRLMFLKEGRLIKDGPTEEVFTSETLREVYDTDMEVAWHPGHARPYAVMLPLSSGTGGLLLKGKVVTG